jgi:sugar phosphate isomerase/epimerase
MKYGIVMSVSKTKFGPVVFKGNVYENIIKASKFNYDGIEFTLKKSDDFDLKKTERSIKNNNLEVIAFGTGQIFYDEGLSFTDVNKSVRDEAVSRVKDIIDIASYFNSSVIIGLIRGKINFYYNYNELKTAEERIFECLEECLWHSTGKNIKFLIEPINRYETNLFNKIEDAVSFLKRFEEKLDIKRIGILADTFHMNIEEPVIEKSISDYAGFISHVHLADSNRLAPGFGHLDFVKVLEALKNSGYKGFLSFEILPYPDSDTAAKKALEFIKNIELM